MISCKRFDDVDIAKCIGIFLVYLGHCEIGAKSSFFDNTQFWIYSFHMPLFFFISGLLFSNTRGLSLKDFFIRKANSLLLPYIFFSLFNLTFLMLFDMKIPNFIVRGWGLNPLWFLPVLFAVEIFHFVFSQKTGLFWKSLLGIVFVFLLLFHVFHNPYGPYGFARIPWFYLFFVLGFLSKKIVTYLRNSEWKVKIVLLAVVCLFAQSAMCFLMEYNDFILVRIMCAVFGTFFVFLLSIYLSKFPRFTGLLCYIGRNTIVVLCTHKLFYEILQKINYQEFLRGRENHLIVFALVFLCIVLYNKYVVPLFDIIRKKTCCCR